MRDKRERFFVQSVSSLFHAVGEWTSPIGGSAPTHHETVFFDDGWLTLGGDERARAKRRVTADARPGGAGPYEVELPRRFGGDRENVPTLEAATDLMCRAFGNDAIIPYCAVRWKRQRFALEGGGELIVDSDVTYFGNVDGRFVDAGTECYPRVELRMPARPSRRLSRALGSLPRLPHTAKRWMGYFRMRKLVKPRRIPELAGYEYELKFDCRRPDVDPACLPFPVRAVYQVESTRYYYDGHRIQFRAFREGRATLVRKGRAEMIEGVPRRPEEKQRGLSPWTLMRPRYALRRVKKTYLLLNEATGRMYNLCLETCSTGEGERAEMTQIEVEFRGRLTPPTGESREAIERAVLDDLRAVERALITRHGLTPSTVTKRAWLKSNAG